MLKMVFKWGKQIQVLTTGEVGLRSLYMQEADHIFGFLEAHSSNKFLRDSKVKTNWLWRRRVTTPDTVTKEQFFPRDLKVGTMKWDKQQL